ncbi:hypothetical protein SAMN05216503_2156 [Polaribacter sp. KT25b]|uniref:hypothetical protein n=1 Tax=Polaribacter sp. KT25b TaxID=1855336 RepID=UPI00087B9DC2|nr:hypothetical protein [Polaribacter sp. KT25b]SDS15588.1 hypothetical protein SAMN05216503_2156 [Polaribacter sp. KT25b]
MKKNKVVNLFGDKNNLQNTALNYSTLLDKFVEQFINKLKEFESQEDAYEFAQNAWNLGNMRSIIDTAEFKNIISLAKDNGEDYRLLEKMTSYKVKHLKEFTEFIVDFDFFEVKGSQKLKVTTQTEDDYLSEMLEINFPKESTEDDFEENFINRSAISLKPLQPFIDWHNTIYTDSKIDETDLKDVNIYLISNATYYEDVEAHLKKKFDNYFQRELEGWHTNKKEWPQRRNYKMFKNWFQINISTAILDLEKTPVSKSE